MLTVTIVLQRTIDIDPTTMQIRLHGSTEWRNADSIPDIMHSLGNELFNRVKEECRRLRQEPKKIAQ